MGLLRQNMVEKSTGTTALSLVIPAGESAVLKDIHYVVPSAAAESVTVSVGRRKVLHFVAASGMYLLGEIPLTYFGCIKNLIRDAGLFPRIPIAAGEELVISGMVGSSYIEAVYDLYEEGDILAEHVNGSKANRFTMFQMISNTAARVDAGDLYLDQSDIDASFPAFPGGAMVPSKYRAKIKALFGAPVTISASSTVGQCTTFLKFLKEREELFDRDLTGFNFLGDATDTSDATVYQNVVGRLDVPKANWSGYIVVIDPPIEFEGGEELNVIATIANSGAGADFAAGDIKLGLLIEMERVA